MPVTKTRAKRDFALLFLTRRKSPMITEIPRDIFIKKKGGIAKRLIGYRIKSLQNATTLVYICHDLVLSESHDGGTKHRFLFGLNARGQKIGITVKANSKWVHKP